MSTSTLLSMLGSAITERPKFQWVKLLGYNNVYWDKSKSDLPLVDRDYICKVFYESQKLQRTTEALANVMLYAYHGWVNKPENTRISGVIAEEIHNRVMQSIATYWKRPWKPEKHKCPIYGILNLFNIVKSYTCSDLLPLKEGARSVKRKIKENKLILDNTSTYEESGMVRAEKYGLINNEVFEWSVFHQVTPLDEIIDRELEESYGV